VLTDAGHLVYGYAEEIFALGRELGESVRQRPGGRVRRLSIGVADSFPKIVTSEFLAPVFEMADPVHVVCREGKLEDLLGQMAAHRLELVLADEPAPSGARAGVRTFQHLLGASDTTFCAAAPLARRLRRGFPRSLHGAPVLMPAEGTSLRRALDSWFRDRQIEPRIVAECDDLALAKVFAAAGRGFLGLPTVAAAEAARYHGFEPIGRAPTCRTDFHAITAERRIAHPAVALLTGRAMAMLRETRSPRRAH
jgi:LysR family transcriptional activator of nhaA